MKEQQWLMQPFRKSQAHLYSSSSVVSKYNLSIYNQGAVKRLVVHSSDSKLEDVVVNSRGGR